MDFHVRFVGLVMIQAGVSYFQTALSLMYLKGLNDLEWASGVVRLLKELSKHAAVYDGQIIDSKARTLETGDRKIYISEEFLGSLTIERAVAIRERL